MTEHFSQVNALGQIGRAAKRNRVSTAELVAKFPERPATPEEFARIMDWIEAKMSTATEGMYRTIDGQIYKVVHAVHGSGHLYAKRLDVATRTFEMAKGMVAKLTQAERMSTAEAAEFGHLYGFCVRCGATLTDETSIARGMGPTCATKI